MSIVMPGPQSSISRHGVWERFDLDEPIDVRCGRFNGSDELSRLFRSLSQPAHGGTALTLVVCLSADQQTLNLGTLLDALANVARVVITSVAEETVNRWPTTFGDLRAEADRRGLKSVRVESDAERAVIGAMQMLHAGDTFAVLAPTEISHERLTGWLTQGARWRGSLEVQDDDGFHHLAE